MLQQRTRNSGPETARMHLGQGSREARLRESLRFGLAESGGVAAPDFWGASPLAHPASVAFGPVVMGHQSRECGSCLRVALPRFAPSDRLQRMCSGPVYAVRSGVCARSHASSGSMSRVCLRQRRAWHCPCPVANRRDPARPLLFVRVAVAAFGGGLRHVSLRLPHYSSEVWDSSRT